MPIFATEVVAAVLHHMNDDHRDDNLLIARAFGDRSAASATMVDLDQHEGRWTYVVDGEERRLGVPWTTEISERAEIRREIVVIYDRACAELGEAPRPHAPAASVPASSVPAPIPFSQALRERTWSSHGESEGAGFMTDLMKGSGTLDDYTQLVAQHWFIYDVLEQVAAAMADDAVIGGLIAPELVRLPAIEADLDHLMGDGWRHRIAPVAATERYCERMREVADWNGGVLAHHYTRYLGDLSGGQHIAKLMQRHFGLGDAGVAFYRFDGIRSASDFKDAYREALDAIAWTPEERERVIDEVLVAYRLNTQLFEDLGAS